eukprot:scaffold14369_cov63-Phaeocystis_antarctica.AAC.1
MPHPTLGAGHLTPTSVPTALWRAPRAIALAKCIEMASNASLRERLVLVAQAGEVEEGVGAVALHAHNVEVAAKVPRVAARDGQAVAEARERRVGAVVARGAEGGGVALEGGRGRGEEVAPDARHVRAPDAAALVGDLDHDVLVVLAVGDDHLDGRHGVVHAVVLGHGAQRVLDELEHAVVQVRRDVGEDEVGAAVQHHLRRVAVRALAQILCILDGLLRSGSVVSG